MNFKIKRDLCLVRQLKPLKKLIKSWYLHAGMKFLSKRQLIDVEESFLEEVTEFFLDNLEKLDEEEKETLEKLNEEDYDTLNTLDTDIPGYILGK